jgi:replicative DNA helicase
MTRLDKLKNLEADLLDLMKKANSRTYASLAKQYRETIKEIEEIEGNSEQSDEIAQILGDRDGMPGAVRANRS